MCLRQKRFVRTTMRNTVPSTSTRSPITRRWSTATIPWSESALRRTQEKRSARSIRRPPARQGMWRKLLASFWLTHPVNRFRFNIAQQRVVLWSPGLKNAMTRYAYFLLHLDYNFHWSLQWNILNVFFSKYLTKLPYNFKTKFYFSFNICEKSRVWVIALFYKLLDILRL